MSLTEEDVALIDDYGRRTGLSSRSAVIRRALSFLRQSELEADYVAAWDEWAAAGDHAEWDATAGDGLGDAAR
ncbi:ribbon-helix-helix protein, CopG family [Blastococcus sp. TF02A-26]|uniref:ribbon-helix-helix protein, CopG family n=1 Tax=Blastococcus sp. TF02A-26 TaxID=2250577 RepID=UPI001F36D58E|nr:ribbon-helix-helix protein, CopG family [Blastococcus sp. TF02A-26]